MNSTTHEPPLGASEGRTTAMPGLASPRATNMTFILGISAILISIVGGAFGILKSMVLISVGIALSIVGLVLAAWALALAVRRASKGGMVVGAIAALGSFFGTTAGILTLLSRILTQGL